MGETDRKKVYDVVGSVSTVVGVCETHSELGQGIHRRFSGRAGTGTGFGRVSWKRLQGEAGWGKACLAGAPRDKALRNVLVGEPVSFDIAARVWDRREEDE